MTRYRVIRRLIVFWMVLCISGYASAVDLQTVLDKHFQALGGKDAIVALDAIKAYSSIEYMGISGKTISIVKFPRKYYTRLDLGVITEEKGFDGSTAWTTDANGITHRDIPEELKPMMNELYVSTYAYLLPGRNPGRTVYRGDTLIGDRGYHHLVMYPEGGDSLSVFINSDNGRLEYRSETVTGIKMITAYHDFRKIGGVEVPFGMDIETPGAPYEITAWVDSAHINPNIPDSLFLMPGISSRDFAFPPEDDSVVIPMKMTGNNVFIEVMVDGRGPFLFMLDSGSASTILSKKLAGKLGINVDGSIPARGVGGFGSIGFGKIDSLNIGGLSWGLKRITVFDFSSLTGGSLGRIEGILGYDFFTRFPMWINFDKAELVLFDPDQPDFSRPDDGFDIDIYCQIPVAELILDGHPIRLAIDLGAQMGIVVQGHSRWYKEMSDKLDGDMFETEIQGVGGIQTVRNVRVDSLNIGDVRIEQPTVMIVDDYAAIPFPDYIEGFLGMGILKRFNLFIDYPDGKIYFKNHGRNDK